MTLMSKTDVNIVKSILDSVPVRELEAIKVEEVNEERTEPSIH